MAENARNRFAGETSSWLGVCLAICIATATNAIGQEANLLNVQPATIKDGEIALYGVIREIPNYPFGEGTVLAVQVTASDSDLTTESRREAQGAPCNFCTTTHYFLVSKENEKRPKILYRTAPGPVTYIHIDKKEYMVGKVDLGWEGDKPQLEKVTLLQTGFAPPLFKRRINVRFDESVKSASHADEIADMAIRDAFAYARPVTVPKVFPPGHFHENKTGTERSAP